MRDEQHSPAIPSSFCKPASHFPFLWEPPADYERLTEMAHSMYGDPEYTLNRIRECMEWGYNHDEEQQNCKTNYSKTVSVPFLGPEDDPWRKSTKSTKSTISLVAPENEGQDIDNQYIYDEKVMDTCVDFLDEVYEELPSFFEPLLDSISLKRDAKILLWTCRNYQYS